MEPLGVAVAVDAAVETVLQPLQMAWVQLTKGITAEMDISVATVVVVVVVVLVQQPQMVAELLVPLAVLA